MPLQRNTRILRFAQDDKFHAFVHRFTKQLFGRRSLTAALLLLGLTTSGVILRAELEEWLQNVEGAGRFDIVFFMTVPLPGGPIVVRRPPAASRDALNGLLAKAPNDAELLLMRARVDEEQLDFAAAEADWKNRAEALDDKAAGQLELADFYHRRLRPLDEVNSLALVGRSPSSPADKLLPATQQRSWRAFERISFLIDAQALPDALGAEQCRAWIRRYPRETAAYSRCFDYLLAHKQFAAAASVIPAYEKAFPADRVYPAEARGWLEYRRGSVEQALALYDQSFQPLWPPDLVQAYFSLLKETHRLRDFLARARAAVNAGPHDVSAASRVFYYYQQQGNIPEAQRALIEFRQRMERDRTPWAPEQLWTLGQLFEGIHNYDEAARCYYALYSLPGADPASQEKALGGIINVLLTAPEQPIRFGSQDFSLLHDIGTLDSSPGFLNGILSLLLNSQQPAYHYAQAEGASVAYFHRGRAAELLPLFDSRFPHSPARPELHAKLLEVYATYGANDAVIRDARAFLASFRNAPQRVHVALVMADALARKGLVKEELAVYDSLLAELAARADHIPLGEQAMEESGNQTPPVPNQAAESENQTPEETEGEAESPPVPRGVPVPKPRARQSQATGARSPEYASVLERYISRLVALKRSSQVLSLLNREIERNPNDPGLYARLARFFDQNRLGQGIEVVYRRAIQQFSGRTWYQKLARWYLRQRRAGDFEKLCREVINIFSGSELQAYFRQVVAQPGIDAQLYLQLNLYAHQRFPHNLAFVNNLLSAYRRPETMSDQSWEALIRQHWFYNDGLRSRYFAFLSSNGRLDGELQAIRRAEPAAAGGRWEELARANPAAAEFISEAELWRSNFEAAAPVTRAVAAVYPTDNALASRAAEVFRSLAAFDPNDTEIAAGIEKALAEYAPGDHAALTRTGEIYADRERFEKSRPYWNRLAELEPGNADGYLEAATVFWDYFLFDDALRLINEGRKKLSQPALYAYEAGAVYENQRNAPRAIREYLQGTLETENPTPARTRLIQLAKRPKLGALVEQATATAVAAPNLDWKAVSLRIVVLEALGRRNDVEKLLAALTESTSSLELLERLDPVAVRLGFDSLHSRTLERRAALNLDPVESLRLRLDRLRFEESKGNIEEARRQAESIYNDYPTLLGVVRGTVDFYWRNKMWDPAIDTLLKASQAAYRDLSLQFTFEASRKATEAKEYQRARDLLGPLLAGDPYNAEYLAAMADTYAREGNDQALRDFYLAKIQAFRDAPLSADERNERVAALRRGLIPALTRLKDYAGALAQYIEIVNRYPEDAALIQEAAAYAERNDRRKQLLDYYTKATADSPKDSRWPIVLARLETYFEDYPAAIASYTRAQQVRPDRSDLLMARAALEERLMRFEQAIESYIRLYDLTYQNPQWMEKVSELYARQGQVDAAVKALRKARIEGRPEKPELFFGAAAKLETWNMLPQAREFAERGVALAGHELLTDASNLEGAKTYATVLTRLRKQEEAFAKLRDAAREGANGQFNPNLLAPFESMGQAVKTYFTPEEKIAFARFLESQKENSPAEDITQTFLPLAHNAGLADLEARWRHELMMAHPVANQPQETALATLQKQRMMFNELGAQLEAYWNVYPQVPGKDRILERAAQSYRSAGNTEGELRALAKAFAGEGLSDAALKRYLALLLESDRQRVVTIAGDGGPPRVKDAAANVAVASGDARLALEGIAARGRGLPPVWTRAYTGLVGLYFADPAVEIGSAYQAALGTGNIGDRVGKRVDRAQQLAGNVWFYYGSRYGEYLALTKQGNPEDYLPAMLEGTPASPDAYTTLADYYQDAGELDRALADYAHALELAPRRGEVQDRIALILWQQGKREDATERWRTAFREFLREENSRSAPPSFWGDVRTALEHVGERKLLPQVREDADKVLRTYVRRNGTYQVEELLRGAVAAAGDPAAGVAWMIDLADAAPNPLSFLTENVDAPWIPKAQQEPLLRRILQLAEREVSQAHGAAQGVAQETLHTWQLRWAGYLLDARRTEEARAALNALPEEARKERLQEVTPLELRLAAQSGTLDATLARYRAQPETLPPLEALQSAAAALKSDGDESSARRVLEFLYTWRIEQHDLSPANFLGLAEVRLQSGDLTQGGALLRRMALVAGEPFENLEAAAQLLLKYGHALPATEFLSARAKAVPWDTRASLDLAKAQIAGHDEHASPQERLSSVAAAPLAPYAIRAEAAQASAQFKAQGVNLGSGEPDWLGRSGPQDVAAAEQPGYFYARVEAAKRVSDPATQVRLLLGAVAIQPDDESPRLPLFRAAVGAGQYQLAYSALEPLLNPNVAGSYRYAYQARNGEGREYARAAMYTTPSESVTFLPGLELSAVERVALAGQVAEVLEKLHRWTEATTYWSTAVALAPAGSSREEFQNRLEKANAELKLHQQDAARRPVIMEHLEQTVLVRPRLSAKPEIAEELPAGGALYRMVQGGGGSR